MYQETELRQAHHRERSLVQQGMMCLTDDNTAVCVFRVGPIQQRVYERASLRHIRLGLFRSIYIIRTPLPRPPLEQSSRPLNTPSAQFHSSTFLEVARTLVFVCLNTNKLRSRGKNIFNSLHSPQSGSIEIPCLHFAKCILNQNQNAQEEDWPAQKSGETEASPERNTCW